MAKSHNWKPILKPLQLSDYHPAYGAEKILVCVNPERKFWNQLSQLVRTWQERYKETARLNNAVKSAQGSDKRAAEISAGQKAGEFFIWGTQVYQQEYDGWFARLWSFGDEKYTAADLAEYRKLDTALVTWLQKRSIELICEHARRINPKADIRLHILPTGFRPNYENKRVN